jgi:hypothetical protein
VSAGLVGLVGGTSRSVKYFVSEDEPTCKHIDAVEAQVMCTVNNNLTGNDVTGEWVRPCIHSPKNKGKLRESLRSL